MSTTVPMWDAVDVSAIPNNSSPIGVYVDVPPFINTVAAVTARFPNAQQVSITAFGVAGARIGDRETGNMSATDLAKWDSDEIAADRRPTNYCSIDSVQECVDAINAIRLPLALIDWFPADWDGVPHLATLPGLHVVGTQFANPKYTGGNYDLSLVLASWLDPFQLPIGARFMGVVTDPKTGNDRVYYAAAGTGNVIQATWDATNGWKHNDLTALAGLPPAAI